MEKQTRRYGSDTFFVFFQPPHPSDVNIMRHSDRYFVLVRARVSFMVVKNAIM